MFSTKTVAASAAIVFLTACAGAFQRPDQSADYGKPPANYEAAIRSHFEGVLKDPESARYKFGKPLKAYANQGLAYGGGIAWTGYLVDVEVNAKNSYGGYTGFSPYMVLFSGDHVFKHIDGSSHVLVHRMEW